MFEQKFLQEIDRANNILIAGAGGGFDIFCGLPLYFALQASGKKVYLANYSFSRMTKAVQRWGMTPFLLDVDADTKGDDEYYFPEKYLCKWFRHTIGREIVVYCFTGNPGVGPLLEAYDLLIEKLSIDSIVLVDGGTDSLLRGDEHGLGTPAEDMTSIAAVFQSNVKDRYLVTLGFGVDNFHGVSHSDVLAMIAKMTREDGFLGSFSLTRNMPEVENYINASKYVFGKMTRKQSIVNTSIIDAINGKFGNHHSTTRTHGSELFINPLMAIYWCFKLDTLANSILYLDKLYGTDTFEDVLREIREFRNSYPLIKEKRDIPI